MDSTKFDDILMGILQHCEQVEPFLDAIFSFLARRTDFFRVMQSREDKMGFPPGVAEKIVLKIFRAYQEMVLRTSSSLEATKKTPGKKSKQAKRDVPSTTTSPELAQPNEAEEPAHKKGEKEAQLPPVASSVEIETSPAKESETSSLSASATKSATVPVGDPEEASMSNESTTRSKPSQQSEGNKDAESQGMTPGKSDECYNGAVLDNYTWSQTIKDIDVRIPVSSSITKARDVGVDIKNSHLKVWIKKAGEDNVIIDGKLQRTIKCEESLWSLEPRKCILINLEKTEERFWTAVLEGDAEIDKTKVDTTRDISDFDEQTQSDFQRVMFDHHQKLQGKPTSQEAKTHELLKQAWNAKGSPFAGTEFDPSRVNISPSYG